MPELWTTALPSDVRRWLCLAVSDFNHFSGLRPNCDAMCDNYRACLSSPSSKHPRQFFESLTQKCDDDEVFRLLLSKKLLSKEKRIATSILCLHSDTCDSKRKATKLHQNHACNLAHAITSLLQDGFSSLLQSMYLMKSYEVSRFKKIAIFTCVYFCLLPFYFLLISSLPISSG